MAISRATAAPQPVSGTALVRRARKVDRLLAETYPDARCELDFDDPFQLLVVTVLSAQTTDRRVNAVSGTPIRVRRPRSEFRDRVGAGARGRVARDQTMGQTVTCNTERGLGRERGAERRDITWITTYSGRRRCSVLSTTRRPLRCDPPWARTGCAAERCSSMRGTRATGSTSSPTAR